MAQLIPKLLLRCCDTMQRKKANFGFVIDEIQYTLFLKNINEENNKKYQIKNKNVKLNL